MCNENKRKDFLLHRLPRLVTLSAVTTHFSDFKLREVNGGEVGCMRRHESTCGLLEAIIARRRVICSGCCGQRWAKNGFMVMLIPACCTEAAESAFTPSAVVSA
jgi:hypothetical protein